jgi:hypothetical protein
MEAQGRFGPPPVVQLWLRVSVVRGEVRVYRSVRREGQPEFDTASWAVSDLADAREACVTELGRWVSP